MADNPAEEILDMLVATTGRVRQVFQSLGTPDISSVTRLVVVNYSDAHTDRGRVIDISQVHVEQALQDDGRTLKIFVYNDDGERDG